MPRTTLTTASRRPDKFGVVGALFLVAAAGLAWANSFNGPFVLDDVTSVVENPSLRNAGSLQWLFPPATSGETVSGRPLLNATFALNYAFGGLDVGSYHALNLALHSFCALLLFGILRRTFERTYATGSNGDWIALATTTLWVLHPLQTAAVTYISQRAEVLAASCILLSVYAFVRAQSSPAHRNAWQALSIASCFLGALAKETAAAAPLIVLLYDRAFVSGSFRAAWISNRRFYAGLFGSWTVLGLLIATNSGRGGSAGFGSSISSWTYLLTQAEAIIGYLRQVVWPSPLVFDYGPVTVDSIAAVWWQGTALALLLGVTCVLLRRNHPLGFAGACFFLLLAPSSSLVPVVTQTIAEHRMYLALALPIGGLTFALFRLGRHMALPVLGVVTVALGLTTHARNATYQNAVTLWQDTVEKRPNNARAQNNLGQALAEAGQPGAAKVAFEKALVLNPRHAYAHFNLGSELLREKQWAEAALHFDAAIAAEPAYSDAHRYYGHTLVQLGRAEEAIRHFRQALTLDPSAQDARIALASLLIGGNQTAEAISLLQIVLASSPDLPEAHYHLGRALEKTGTPDAAATAYRTAIRLRPDWAPGHLALAHFLAQRKQLDAAYVSYREALTLDPTLAEAYFGLGNLYASRQQFTTAAQLYSQAIARAPSHFQAHANLGNCQLALGQPRAAIASYEAALRIRPDDESIKTNLRIARETASGR